MDKTDARAFPTKNKRIVLVGGTFFFFIVTAFAQQSYHMLDTPQPFTGSESQSAQLSDIQEVRIGLFSPDQSAGPVARALIRGVSLALEEANQRGGYHGHEYKIIRRWSDDPWGAASKEVIRLLYEDHVWLLIGSIHGESAHVAQQIVTKAWAPFISPLVSDPSLTHSNIPWIFRLPPDDHAQADVLIREGVLPQRLRQVGLLTSTDHDGRYAADELKKAIREQNISLQFHLTLDPQTPSLAEIAQRAMSFPIEGLVIRLPANRMAELLRYLSRMNEPIPVFLPWIPGLNEIELRRVYAGPITVVDPFSPPRQCSAYLSFVRKYVRRFAEKPAPEAAYAYDAACLALQAIELGGLSRVAIAKALTGSSGFEGGTGLIQWDNGGGNLGQPAVRVLE